MPVSVSLMSSVVAFLLRSLPWTVRAVVRADNSKSRKYRVSLHRLHNLHFKVSVIGNLIFQYRDLILSSEMHPNNTKLISLFCFSSRKHEEQRVQSKLQWDRANHATAQLSTENIPQVKQRDTSFSFIFDSSYWIHFCAEDAKKASKL